jgi:hypothetical protein
MPPECVILIDHPLGGAGEVGVDSSMGSWPSSGEETRPHPEISRLERNKSKKTVRIIFIILNFSIACTGRDKCDFVPENT